MADDRTGISLSIRVPGLDPVHHEIEFDDDTRDPEEIYGAVCSTRDWINGACEELSLKHAMNSYDDDDDN